MARQIEKEIAPAPLAAADWLGLIARVALGAVFIVSGASKAASPIEEFSYVIGYYQIVSPDMALSLATFLPWLELLVGFSLATGYFTRQVAAAAGTLLLGFIGALLSTKARGILLPNCGCFGGRFHPPVWTTIAMDSGLTVFAVAAFKKGARAFSLDRWSERV